MEKLFGIIVFTLSVLLMSFVFRAVVEMWTLLMFGDMMCLGQYGG